MLSIIKCSKCCIGIYYFFNSVIYRHLSVRQGIVTAIMHFCYYSISVALTVVMNNALDIGFCWLVAILNYEFPVNGSNLK